MAEALETLAEPGGMGALEPEPEPEPGEMGVLEPEPEPEKGLVLAERVLRVTGPRTQRAVLALALEPVVKPVKPVVEPVVQLALVVEPVPVPVLMEGRELVLPKGKQRAKAGVVPVVKVLAVKVLLLLLEARVREGRVLVVLAKELVKVLVLAGPLVLAKELQALAKVLVLAKELQALAEVPALVKALAASVLPVARMTPKAVALLLPAVRLRPRVRV